jgi:GNAT superfamily N-acetyltransferase
MELLDISADTERAFFTCLHLERPENLKSTTHRRNWYAEHKDKGYKTQVLVLDDGRIVGKCHYVPIEHAPFVGQDLLAILCIYVHMYEHHIGDQRRRGYGRFMLNHVERYARSSGFKGIVAWAMDWDWNPVSFYEHAGYSRVDAQDKVVVVWKPFCADAEPPRLLRLDDLPGEGSEKVRVLVADNQWCDSNWSIFILGRDQNLTISGVCCIVFSLVHETLVVDLTIQQEQNRDLLKILTA